MTGTEIALTAALVISVAFNVVQQRWWQTDRAEMARMRGEREDQARAEREAERTRRATTRSSNDPGPRAHADCMPGQPCLSGRDGCPYGTTGVPR